MKETHEETGSEQESVKVLVLGRFVKAQVLVFKAVGKPKSNKDAGKGFAMEMWKAAQNAAFHIPTATAAAAG